MDPWPFALPDPIVPHDALAPITSPEPTLDDAERFLLAFAVTPALDLSPETGILPSAPAGIFHTIVEDGFALAIVFGSVALAFVTAGAIVAIVKLAERIVA